MDKLIQFVTESIRAGFDVSLEHTKNELGNTVQARVELSASPEDFNGDKIPETTARLASVHEDTAVVRHVYQFRTRLPLLVWTPPPWW